VVLSEIILRPLLRVEAGVNRAERERLVLGSPIRLLIVQIQIVVQVIHQILSALEGEMQSNNCSKCKWSCCSGGCKEYQDLNRELLEALKGLQLAFDTLPGGLPSEKFTEPYFKMRAAISKV
jgi:hypothetical protein